MLFDNAPSLAYVVGSCLLTYLVYSILLHPLLLHPLRNVPRAHWSVAFPYVGSVWILIVRYRQRNNATTYKAHVEHGSVVRLAYNELSINCVDNGIRTVYGGGWEKHEWYARQFAGYGVINMFTTVHHEPHSQKKRTISNIYSKSNIQGSQQIKCNSLEILGNRLLPLLQSSSQSDKPTDVHDLNNALTMDFMSAYLFGIKRSTDFLRDVATRKKIMHIYHSRRDYEWHSAEVPPQLKRWLKALGISFVPMLVDVANDFLENWNDDMCSRAENYLETHPDGPEADDLGDEPIVYKYFKLGMEKMRGKNPAAGRELLPHIYDPTPFLSSPGGLDVMLRNELHSEMYDHLSAGHETSAIGLTYLYWELSKAPLLQDRLHSEVTTLRPSIYWPSRMGQPFSLPDSSAIDSLPLLDAILLETLRLHAPIPGNEPRVSPQVAGGSTLGSFKAIPGGVRVSAMPFTLHRNPEVFPNPEKFDPDRWLISDEARLKEMHRWFWAFGSGGRMCIGRHLAIQEMKLAVAAIYTNWTTSIFDDQGIEELDVYTTRPRSNKLMLKFKHRMESSLGSA